MSSFNRMAQKEEAAAAETKNVVINPRVEIDTSPPFESVKEAVVRFGGSGPWIPHHLLRLAPTTQEHEEVLDLKQMEEQAVKYERDLMMKEQEALNVLKEVEAAKRFVEGLKVNLMEEVPPFVSNPGFTSQNQMQKLTQIGPVQSPGYVLMELDQAKVDLNRMTMDLAVIRTSVESLNKKMRKEQLLLQKSSLEYENDSSTTKQQVNDRSLEAEQFKKMAEASRYEVMKAMSEIERTKGSIKIAEMRLVAAKKMEEAAKAVEAIAFAEKSNSNSSATPQGIILPYEEYYALTQKALQAEQLCKIKFVDSTTQVGEENKKPDSINEDGCQRKMDRTQHGVFARSLSRGNPRQRNDDEPHIVRDKPLPVFRSSISIGDILSRKLILQDDIMVGNHVERRSKEQHVSFSQMLREQSGIILNPAKSGKDNGSTVHKQYIAHRKKFGFIQVPIIHKHNKKKTQSVNLR